MNDFLLFLLLISVLALPQRALGDPPSSEAFTLENGVRVLLEVDKTRPTISYATAWRLDHSAPGKAGSAHLLQHNLEAAPAMRPLREFLRREKASIAHESLPDANLLQIDCPKAILMQVLEMDRDRLKDFTIDEKDLQQEKLRVIEEQVRNRNATLGLEESAALASFAYRDPWYHQPAEGLEKSINSIGARELGELFQKHYKAGNLTIALVGDFDRKLLRAKLQGLWQSFPASGSEELAIEQTPSFQTTLTRREFPLFNKKRMSLTLGFPIPDWSSKETAAMEILSDMLTKGDNSLINTRLFKQQKLLLAARSEVPIGARPQLFSIYLLAADNVNEGSALKALRGLLEELARHGIGKEELNALKAQRIAEYQAYVRSSPASALVLHDLFHASFLSLHGRLESYAKLSSADIQRVLGRYFLNQEPFIIVGVEKSGQR